jgi:hypothetical protein
VKIVAKLSLGMGALAVAAFLTAPTLALSTAAPIAVTNKKIQAPVRTHVPVAPQAQPDPGPLPPNVPQGPSPCE